MKTKFHYCLLFTLIFVSCSTETPKEYVINELDLVPEGIAYSSNTDSFYLTSVAKSKIISVDRQTGEQNDFISEREFGYMPGAGIWVNDEQNLLYALGGYFKRNDSPTSLFVFNLANQTLMKRYDLFDENGHFLNDLVIDNNGNVFITDTKASSIYSLAAGSDSLTLFYDSPEIKYPNGIALSDDNTKLYIASHIYGVRVMDIAQKKILNEIDTLGISNGIDGLEFYKGDLYALQNGVRANGYNFRRLILNEDQSRIIDFEVIDGNNVALDEPLTFCIVENQAVVIANSNLQFLDQIDYTYSPDESAKKTILLVYNLGKEKVAE